MLQSSLECAINWWIYQLEAVKEVAVGTAWLFMAPGAPKALQEASQAGSFEASLGAEDGAGLLVAAMALLALGAFTR